VIELRLLMIEEGQPDRNFVIKLAREELIFAAKIRGDLGPFNSPEIHELNNRRGQADLIKRAVAMLGVQAADFRDDRDGWNGERRAEIIASQHRR
jgi:hypothetical protein